MARAINAIGFGILCFATGVISVVLIGTSRPATMPAARYQVATAGKEVFVLDTQTGQLWMREGPQQFDMGAPDHPTFKTWSLQRADRWLYEHRRNSDIDLNENGDLTFKNDYAAIFPGLAPSIEEHRKAGWSDGAIALDIRQKTAQSLADGLASKAIEEILWGPSTKPKP
jgi:hypothetical protein